MLREAMTETNITKTQTKV